MLTWLTHRAKAFLNDSGGAVATEFAIVAPFLVVLALGAAEIGRAIQHHHTVEKSARDAARYLSRVPASCTGGIDASYIATAKNLAWTGYVNGTTPLLPYWQNPAGNSTVTVTVGCFANTGGVILNRVNGPNSSGIPLVSVSIDVPYQDIGFLGLLGIPLFAMQSAHSEVSIGE